MEQERNLNFDEVVERKDTDSLKYDFAVRRGKPADVLPLWVADMDFKTSSFILDAVEERARHGIFGYTETREDYFEALRGWMKSHHEHLMVHSPSSRYESHSYCHNHQANRQRLESIRIQVSHAFAPASPHECPKTCF